MKTIVTFLLSTFFSLGNAQGILVHPATVDFKLEKGQSSTATIYIENHLSIPKQFKIYVNDWLRDSVGGHKYMAPNSNPFSCAGWIKIDKDFVELEPGKSTTLSVNLKMPDETKAAEQMTWAMIFVESVEEAKPAAISNAIQTSVVQIMRVGIHIYETPPSVINKDLKMTSFSSYDSSDTKYRIICQNTGAVQLSCKSFLELTNLVTGEKTKLDNAEFPMFPNQTRYIDYKLPETLAKGKYNVVAAVDAGEDVPLEAAQKTIEIK